MCPLWVDNGGRAMNLTVPDLTIACMIVSCVIAFGLPILLALYFHKKKGEFIPMIVGIAVMFVFVFTLEAAAIKPP